MDKKTARIDHSEKESVIRIGKKTFLHLQMRNVLLNISLLSAFLLPVLSFSQNNDTLLIRQCIEQLFDGMRKADSSKVRAAFHPQASLQSTVKTKTGESKLIRESVDEFAKVVGTPHNEAWNEIIWSYDTKIDGLMASVWAPYTFYLGEKMSHCGVNCFTLMNTGSGWKILSITDTRKKDNCREK